MSHSADTRICPICHSLLWEEDFLKPEDLEVWEESRGRIGLGHHGNGHDLDPEAELLELAELILELFLTFDVDD